MKILMITPYLPYPLLSGGQTRSYNLIKNLASDYQISLFSFIRDQDEQRYKSALAKYCKKIKMFKRRPAWSPLNIFLSAVTPYPFLVSIYLSKTFRQALKKELQKESYDLIHAETFYVMPNIPKTTVPILLIEQTIEYMVYQHYVECAAPTILKPLLWLDVAKVKFWEKHFWARASRVVAMSNADKKKMQSILPGLEVDIVPNGVDVEAFRSKKKKKLNQITILYVGNFKWLQNREAVEILLTDVWPQVKKTYPQAHLWIVGRGQTAELKRLATADVNFDEHVDDIRQAYSQADLILAPIEGPGGTRLKILEAMASSCPVVTTPVGIEGIEAEHGIHVMVGKTPNELAAHAIRVLRDDGLRQRLTSQAFSLVKQKYNWQDITKNLAEIYRKVGYGEKN